METIINTYRKTSSSHKIWFDWNKELKILMPLWPAQTVDLEKLSRKPSYLLSSTSLRSHWIEDRSLFWELQKYPHFKFLLLRHLSFFLIIQESPCTEPFGTFGVHVCTTLPAKEWIPGCCKHWVSKQGHGWVWEIAGNISCRAAMHLHGQSSLGMCAPESLSVRHRPAELGKWRPSRGDRSRTSQAEVGKV